jgi:hypothetical protein
LTTKQFIIIGLRIHLQAFVVVFTVVVAVRRRVVIAAAVEFVFVFIGPFRCE